MKHFLDLTGLTQFLAKLKTIFTEEITSSYVAPEEGQPGYDESYEDTPSGGFTYMTRDSSGNLTVPHNVTVKNVVTTDSPGGTPQTISGDKTFTGDVVVPTPTENGHAATKAYVDEVLTQAEAMTYKGTIGASGVGDIQTLPLETSGSGKSRTPVTGDTYKVVTAGTYTIATGVTQDARVGDLFIAKVANGTGTQAVTWSYIPSGDETETFVAITDGDTSQSHPEVNINTNPASGNVYFGEAAAKQVATAFSGTYNTDAANNGELTTVGAVTAYALKDVTAGSGITVGTKASGTNSVKVNNGNGLTFDNSTGKLQVQAKATNPGLAVDGSGVRVVANTAKGIAVTGSGVGITLTTVQTVQGMKDISGLEFDANDGSLQVNAGSGLAIGYSTGLAIDLAVAKPYPGGSDYDASGLTFDNNGRLKVSTGEGLEIVQTDGTGEDYNSHLQVKLASQTTIDPETEEETVSNISGLEFNANGALQINVGSGLTGLHIGNSGELDLALATPSVSGVGGSAGAMSAADKEKLNNLSSSYANKLDAEQGTGADADKVKLNLKNNAQSVSTLDTVNLSSANKALSLTASNAQSGNDTNLEFTVNVDQHNGLKVDSSTGIKLDVDTAAGLKETASGNKLAVNAGNGTQFNGTSGAIEVKAYDGITVDSNGVSADIDTTDGLEFTGTTAGSKKIGVKANSAKGIESTSNGVGIVVLTNSGLSFDNTTGGQENGALYIETIPLTGENSIESLFA